VGALIKGNKPYTKGIAKVYEWQGKLGGKSPSTRPDGKRQEDPNDIRGNGQTMNKLTTTKTMIDNNYFASNNTARD
jgi:hypothetical protein